MIPPANSLVGETLGLIVVILSALHWTHTRKSLFVRSLCKNRANAFSFFLRYPKKKFIEVLDPIRSLTAQTAKHPQTGTRQST